MVSTKSTSLVNVIFPFFKLQNVPKSPKQATVTEKSYKGRLSVRVTSDGKKSFEMKMPKLFAKNVPFEAHYTSPNECGIAIKWMQQIFGINGNSVMRVNREIKKINDKEISSDKIEASVRSNSLVLSLGAERLNKLLVFYTSALYNIYGMQWAARCGISKSEKPKPFLKAILSKKISLRSGAFFVDSELRGGQIFGPTSITEKFFLGSNIRGYKEASISPIAKGEKIGGRSFIDIRNRFGVAFCGIEGYVFGDVGVCSTNNIKYTFQSLREFGNHSSIGKSVGCGISLSDGKGVSLTYSIPLTDHKEVEKYSVNVDVVF